MATELITKYVPKSIVTAKGHLDQEFKNLQSTKTSVSIEEENIDPNQKVDNILTDDITCRIFDTKELDL